MKKSLWIVLGVFVLVIAVYAVYQNTGDGPRLNEGALERNAEEANRNVQDAFEDAGENIEEAGQDAGRKIEDLTD